MGKINSKYAIVREEERLAKSMPVPVQDSPAWTLMVKKGMHVNVWHTLWRKYTRGNIDLQWPVDGSFDILKIEYLQSCLLDQKVRHAMWEAFKVWDQYARMLCMKEQREREKAKGMAERANEYNKERRRQIIEENEREHCMLVERSYVSRERKIEDDDPLIKEILDTPPPPYVVQPVVQQNLPVAQVNAPVPVLLNVQNAPNVVGQNVLLQPVPSLAGQSVPVAVVSNASSNVQPTAPPFYTSTISTPLIQGAHSKISSFSESPMVSVSSSSTPRTLCFSKIPVDPCNSITRSQFLDVDKQKFRELANAWMDDMEITLPSAFQIFNKQPILIKNFILTCITYKLIEYWDEIYSASQGEERCPQDVITMSRQAENGLLTDVSCATLLEECWQLKREAHYKLDNMIAAQSSIRKNRAFPMREIPPILQPGVGNAPAGHQSQFVHMPWTRSELVAIKKELPDPRKNPAAFYEGLESAMNLSIMTLKDIEMLFGFVVPTETWRQVRDNDDAATGIVWARVIADDLLRVPGALPLQSVRDLPARLILRLQQLIPRANVNWDRLAACKQKDGEEVTDFFTKMEEMFKAHSGQDLATVAGRRIFANQFVTNLTKEIGDLIRQSESSWPAKEPAELLTMAVYYENMRNTEKGKKDLKIKELKTKVLLQQAFPIRGRMFSRGVWPRGGVRGRGVGRAASAPAQQSRADIGYNTCAYCHEEGHWKESCPNLIGQFRGRGRARSLSRGRGEQGPNREDQTWQPERNYFDNANTGRNYLSQDWEQDIPETTTTFEYSQ